MLIQVWQSGGFAGGEPIQLGRLDTSQLPPVQQKRAEQLAQAIENPATSTVPIGADMVEYRIEVSDDGDQRTIVVADDMNPENPLLQSVHELLELVGSGS